MKGVPCEHLCPDGQHTKVRMDGDRQPQLVCETCPADSIAIRGGFSFDARTTSSGFPDVTNKDLAKFQATCAVVDFNKVSAGDYEGISDNCQSWRFSGRSLIA